MHGVRWLLVVTMLALPLVGCSRPVSPHERALFVTGQDLSRVGCDTNDGSGRDDGYFTKQHIPFMYDTLQYKLSALGASVPCKVVIAASITIARDATVAKQMYQGGAGGAQIGLTMTHIDFARAKDGYRYGAQSEYFNLVKHRRIVGLYFQSRIGRVVYQYLVFGLRFGTARAFGRLFQPKLELARRRYRVQT